MSASARRAATSTLRAARSPPIIPPAPFLGSTDRGEAVAAMGEAFARFVSTRGDIDAMLGISSGGDGTFIVTKGMQSLRIGVQKADGFNARRRRCRTLCRCRGPIDLAGLNNISRTVLRDAAFGIVGMARAGPAAGTGKPPIVLTMFGVTTPCVTAITEQLRGRFDCIVFHATGTGVTRDGKTRRQRLPLWCDRRHHNRGLRSPARRRAGADRLSATTWSIFVRSTRCRRSMRDANSSATTRR
jgi:uncharacterized protein (UPF0261 family)